MRATVLALAAAALVPAFAPVVAADPPPEPAGRRCAYAATTDPRPGAPEDRMTGEGYGGPMVGEGTLICTLRVNSNRHDGPYVWRKEQPAVAGVAAFAESLEYDSGDDDQDYLCTSWRQPDGTTLYWHPGVPDQRPWRSEPGYWTTDGTAPCSAAVQIPGYSLIDEIDYIVCSYLLQDGHTGPYDPQQPYRVYVDDDGDVYLDDDGDGRIQGDEIFWDCPPYGWHDPADDPLQ